MEGCKHNFRRWWGCLILSSHKWQTPFFLASSTRKTVRKQLDMQRVQCVLQKGASHRNRIHDNHNDSSKRAIITANQVTFLKKTVSHFRPSGGRDSYFGTSIVNFSLGPGESLVNEARRLGFSENSVFLCPGQTTKPQTLIVTLS